MSVMPCASHRPSSLPRALTLLLTAALFLGCGGATLTQGTLPREETSQLELIPRDAFLAGRLDLRALQATPHWEYILERLREDDATLAQLAADTGRLYFAVGGLVPAPPIPPMYDDEQNYQPQPAWADLARHFNGRIPKVVAIVEGAMAQMCVQAMEGFDPRERSGYRIADISGVAVITRGQSFCALTWSPLVDALLAEHGPTAAIATHLAVEGGGIAQLALRLDGPVVAEMLSDVDPNTVPREAEEPLPDGLTDEQLEEYRAALEASRLRSLRMANFSRAVTRIVMHGVRGATWQLGTQGDGFETRTQVVTDDNGRMRMWRELTEVYFDVMRALVAYEVLPAEGHPVLAEFVRDVQIVEQRGGYQIVRHTRHEVIAEFLQASVPRRVEEAVAVVQDPGAEERAALEDRINESTRGTAAETIAVVEPNIAFVRESPYVYFRARVLMALADAYASTGRFADAERLMDEELQYLRSYQPTSPDGPDFTEEAQGWVCVEAAAACEIHLAHGDAERALAAVRADSPQREGTCAQERLDALSCEAAATATLGRADEALALLDASAMRPSGMGYAAARARVLALAGRHEQVLSLVSGLCAGGAANPDCAVFFGDYAESLAATARTLAAAEPVFTSFAERRSDSAGSQADDELAVRVQAADCALRARVAANAEPTRAVCAAALERALTVHGEAHPQVAAIRLSYARALQAARQRDEATAQRAAAAAVVETLGPQHPLRGR